MTNKLNQKLALLLAVSLLGCTPNKEFQISKEEKICVPNDEIVAYETINGISQVTTNIKIPYLKNTEVYVHFMPNVSLASTIFGEELAKLIQSDTVPNGVKNDLVKLKGEEAGVFHLFHQAPNIELNDYGGSCFTLSEDVGECTFLKHYPSYQVKIDIGLKYLNQWTAISPLVEKHLSGYECT